MDKQRIDKVISIWKDFAGMQKEPEKLKLNPDTERINLLAEGVLNNEDSH